MFEDRFTSWAPWRDRHDAPGLKCPGVYVIAVTTDDIAGIPFSWRPDIAYVGMTNAGSGLRGRLMQFDSTIRGKRGHGGADRFRYKYRDYEQLAPLLFVAVASFSCDARTQTPGTLRILGQVAAFEYECLAYFLERFSALPEFNNKASREEV